MVLLHLGDHRAVHAPAAGLGSGQGRGDFPDQIAVAVAAVDAQVVQGAAVLGFGTDHHQVRTQPEPVRLGRLGLGRRGGDRHPVGEGVLGPRRHFRHDHEVQQRHAQRHRSHHPQHAVDVRAGGPDHHHLAGARHLGEGEQRSHQHAQRRHLLELAGQAQQRVVADAGQALASFEDLGGDVQQLQQLGQADEHHRRHRGAGQEHAEDVAI